ncbi:MAG: hypothetical protein ACI82F_004482 [Planctomycetota bacterium]|jgi:hypothetical protein
MQVCGPSGTRSTEPTVLLFIRDYSAFLPRSCRVPFGAIPLGPVKPPFCFRRRTFAAPRARHSRWAAVALLLTIVCALPQVTSARALVTLPQTENGSLEVLLRRARAQQLALLARLQEPVNSAVEAIEKAQSDAEFLRAKENLLALGPEAAPLMVKFLTPGDNATSSMFRRASTVGDVLAGWGAPGISRDLFAMARSKDKDTRHQALRVLPYISDRIQVRTVLAEFLAGDDRQGRLDGAQGLAQLAKTGDTASISPLRGLLFAEDTDLINIALETLAFVGDTQAEPQVREIAKSASRAAATANSLLSYYQIIGREQRAAIAADLVSVSARSGLSLAARRILLELVVDLEPPLVRELKLLFEPLLDNAAPLVQDEARICLALLGDRSAERELERKYDDDIKRSPFVPAFIEARAAIKLRLGEYGDASRDYQTGVDMRLAGDMNVPRLLYVELARAYCLNGKIKQSRDALGNAFLSAGQRRATREDEDFRALLEHSRYGKILRD